MTGARARGETPPATWIVTLLVGVVVGGIGPRLVGARDRAAGRPFEYVPPAGFVPAGEDMRATLESTVKGAQHVWVKPTLEGALGTQYRPNVSLVHTSKRAPLDDAELAQLARGMPQVFAASGVAWTELRHEAHERPDGARVGVIEGAATTTNGKGGALAYRSLQMAFPDDQGTSIVTASFPNEAAQAYEAAFDASMDDAKGVAFVAPAPVGWAYVAWGSGGALGALLVMTLVARGAKRAARDEAPASATETE